MFEFLENFAFETKKEAVQYGAIFLLERNLITDPGILFESAFWGWHILADEEGDYDLENNEHSDEYYRVSATHKGDKWGISIKAVTNQDIDPDPFWYE